MLASRSSAPRVGTVGRAAGPGRSALSRPARASHGLARACPAAASAARAAPVRAVAHAQALSVRPVSSQSSSRLPARSVAPSRSYTAAHPEPASKPEGKDLHAKDAHHPTDVKNAQGKDAPAVVPPSYGHVTGPEKMQITMSFYHGESVSAGPFGTLDHPVVVESVFEHRTVGCEGGPTTEDEHEILWHNVWETKPTMCAECGQVFQLKRIDYQVDGEPDAHAHAQH